MSDQELSKRKQDHIDLTSRSQTSVANNNSVIDRFDYEPLLSGFPTELSPIKAPIIAGKTLKAPLWVSSMTGGTGPARDINLNLAKICGEFGLGMGLGSCRPLLESDEFFNDFALRPIIGERAPLFANIGVAQVQELMANSTFHNFIDLCQRLQVDGFFIHVNPLQEWHQRNGDRWTISPLDLIDEVLNLIDKTDLVLGVKEVGQGMGPRSLEALLLRPLEVVEFAAFGGTNFSYLEQLRDEKEPSPLSFVGHSAEEMLDFANSVVAQKGKNIRCQSLIISGGVRSSLEGHYYMTKSLLPAAYGMASPFLQAASKGEQFLRDFVQTQVEELRMATAFLHI